jgi:ABC-type transporter Mla maintaining outer membrane lipid asymmetry ATPase subunit MlaF
MASAFMVSDRIAMLSECRIVAVLPSEEFRHSQNAAIHSFVTAMSEGGARPGHKSGDPSGDPKGDPS